MPPIRKLDDSTIRLISAGEVIHRPVNAIKELIENCIDAFATKIEISVLDGGLRSITILDNGSGIHVEDFALVCERHSTSKLHTFEDLSGISTFGFRGEALASISSISRLKLTSKVENAPTAYTASYLNGHLTSGPDACAWKYEHGSCIEILDLFYTLPTRRQVMLQNATSEYKKILEVIYSYSLNYFGAVEFTFRNNSSNKEFCGSCEENILKSILTSTFNPKALLHLEDAVFSDLNFCISKAIFSSTQHYMTEFTLILFINGRLVESKEIRNALKQLYGEVYLSKSKNPFVFISLSITSDDIDVNYHPAKKEVLFCKAEEVAQKICLKLQEMIKSSNIFISGNLTEKTQFTSPISTHKSSPSSTKTPIRHRAMTDHSSQRIDTFIYREENSLSTVKRRLEIDMSSKKGEHSPLKNLEAAHELNTKKACGSFTAEKTIVNIEVPNNSSIFHVPIIDHVSDELTNWAADFLQSTIAIFSDVSFKNWISKAIYIGLYKEESCFVQKDLGLYEFNCKELSIRYYQHILATSFISNSAIKHTEVHYSLRYLLNNSLAYLSADGIEQTLSYILDFYGNLAPVIAQKFSLLGFQFDDKKENLMRIPKLLDHRSIPSIISLGIFLLRVASISNSDASVDNLLCEIALCFSFIDHLEEHERDNFLRHTLFPSVKSYARNCNTSQETKTSYDCIYRKIVDVPALFKTFERC